MSFDIRKFLTENKLTKASKAINENAERAFGGTKDVYTSSSVLEPILQQINTIQDYSSAKALVVDTIVNSKIAQEIKDKMLADVEATRNLEELLKYVYYSYLAKAGLRSPDSKKKIKEQGIEVTENTDVFTDEEVVDLAFKAGEYVLDAKEALLDAAVGYSGGVPRKVVERILYNYDLSLEDFLSDLADEQEYHQEQDQWKDDPYNYIDQKFSDNHFDDLMENKKTKKQNTMSFDIRKFLTENKLTRASRLLKENYTPEMEDFSMEEDPMFDPSMEETLNDQPADIDTTDGKGVNNSFDASKYESVDQLMREIEVTANRASLQEKMKRVKEAYESLEQKATALEEGEDSKYVSSAKLKEMKKSAKTLRKMYEKYEKDYDKRYNEQMKPKKKVN